MAQLRQDYQGFVDRDTEILAIGPEDLDAFEQYWTENDMPFVGLADPEHVVAKLYRQEVKLLKLGRVPAQLIVDQQGRIRYQYYGHSMSDISPNERLFTVLDQLNRETSAS